MKIEKADLQTPANVTTVLGLALTIWGAIHLNSLAGVIAVIVGRILDVVDGRLARKYHSSRFGAALDGTADKVAIFTILIFALYYDAVPLLLIVLIGLHNLINMGITLYAEKMDKHPESSKAGKQSIFFENVALATYTLSHVIDSTTIQTSLRITGFVTACAGLALGIVATKGYISRSLAKK